MFAALIAGALAFSAQPPGLVGADGEQLALADAAPAVACLDRYLASPDADAAAREFASTLAREGPSRAGPPMPPGVAACLAMVPAGSEARDLVQVYGLTSFSIRSLRAYLATASVDVSALERLAASPETRPASLLGPTGEAELRRLAVSAHVPEAHLPAAEAFLFLLKFEPLTAALVHQPAHPARLVSGSIEPGDYPVRARRRGMEGRTTVAFTIAPEGHVTDCEVIGPSGHALLDERSCSIMIARFRYEPARDDAGRAVPQFGMRRIEWRLSD